MNRADFVADRRPHSGENSCYTVLTKSFREAKYDECSYLHRKLFSFLSPSATLSSIGVFHTMQQRLTRIQSTLDCHNVKRKLIYCPRITHSGSQTQSQSSRYAQIRFDDKRGMYATGQCLTSDSPLSKHKHGLNTIELFSFSADLMFPLRSNDGWRSVGMGLKKAKSMMMMTTTTIDPGSGC